MDSEDLAILQVAARASYRNVSVTVDACDYNCCGKGWLRREGYEQQYVGRVGVVDSGMFTLTSLGIGTISYVISARFEDVLHVEWSD